MDVAEYSVCVRSPPRPMGVIFLSTRRISRLEIAIRAASSAPRYMNINAVRFVQEPSVVCAKPAGQSGRASYL
jgi:hypothetical protein